MSLPLAEIALLLSLYRYPDTDLTQYRQHLDEIAATMQAIAASDTYRNAPDILSARREALQSCIHDKYTYEGDINDYDHLDNASLVRVIDRRRGLPIALTILHVHAARSVGWDVTGLNFPGHVYARIEGEQGRLLFDPFDSAQEVQAHDLRQAIKRLFGPQAELSVQYYAPMTNRDMLIRLQNNIKLRLLEKGDEQGALHIVNGMRLFAPKEHRLLLDAGVLYARAGERKQAGTLLEEYLTTLNHPSERAEIIALLRSLHETMN